VILPSLPQGSMSSRRARISRIR